MKVTEDQLIPAPEWRQLVRKQNPGIPEPVMRELEVKLLDVRDEIAKASLGLQEHADGLIAKYKKDRIGGAGSSAGFCLDSAYEDVDEMIRCLQIWRDSNAKDE